ncbi:MAG: hypothetical protein A2X49_16745 [Lentisphaerae bacterium GWF2_52_8]|nr:MAG: hypothetical protein A2X49_16745 [Lentisphaerae bacterium GWF2_52_8]
MSLKKRFRQIKKLPSWFYIPPSLLLRGLHYIMRTRIEDPYDTINRKDAVVSVTWHNRLLFFPVMIPAHARKHTVAVVSPSRDGQYIADLLLRFGLRSLRGSSSKRGGPVLHEAIKALKDGYHVSFTPDGPRGPCYEMKAGPIYLASITGRPIVPIAVNASSYWSLGSWDRFQIPKPWSRLSLVLGEEIHIPPNLDEAGLEEWRKIVEKRLRELSID